jgi:hypothetical protein
MAKVILDKREGHFVAVMCSIKAGAWLSSFEIDFFCTNGANYELGWGGNQTLYCQCKLFRNYSAKNLYCSCFKKYATVKKKVQADWIQDWSSSEFNFLKNGSRKSLNWKKERT